MKDLSLLLLLLQCVLLQFTCTRAALSFTFSILSHSTSGNCDTAVNSGCETFFINFCLRGPRDFQTANRADCPLGRNDNDLRTPSGSRTITSGLPWQGGFQLFFVALDDDGSFNDPDHLADVFIDRSLAVGAGTTPVEVYTSGRITLQMQFRVECLDNYFGEDCAVFCEEQNSVLTGFYTCNENDGSRICRENYYGPNCNVFCQESSSEESGFFTCNEDTGAMICNAGFTGTSCTDDIDECAGGPCENGGTCIDMIAGFECDCPAGYTGETCLVDIDECLAADCPGNSSCVEDAVDSFLCMCNPGFEGENCTEIQPCESARCENGGTCESDDPFSYNCLCPPGFTGTHCEVDVDECSLVECDNGGSCITPRPSSFQCVCPEGFSGNTCEFSDTAPSQQIESLTSIFIGAAVGGAVVVLVLLIVIILVVILLTRRKAKYYRASNRESHIYQPSPNAGEVKCVSLSSNGRVRDEDNPLYGTQLSETAFASEPTSPEIRTFDNTLYGQTSSTDAVIYDQIHSNTRNAPPLSASDSGDDVIDTSTNISYESLRSPHRQQTISNPMYVATGSTSTASPPPTYSVPKLVNEDKKLDSVPFNNPMYVSTVEEPVASSPPTYSVVPANGLRTVNVTADPEVPPPTGTDAGLQEVDGYTMLRDGRSTSPPSAVPPPQNGDPEAGYDLPATSRQASRDGTRYNKLQHPSEQQSPVVRLSALAESGYSTLETEY